MGTTNIGNQKIIYAFSTPLESNEMSYRYNGGIVGWKGIISGGWMTKVNNTTVSVSPLCCEIPFQGRQYRVQTTSAVQVESASTTTSKLIVSFSYRRQHLNYADFTFISSATSLSENQVCIGECIFSGTPSVMSGSFSYSNRKLLEVGEIGTELDQINGLGGLWLKDTGENKLYRVTLENGELKFEDKTATVPINKKLVLVND